MTGKAENVPDPLSVPAQAGIASPLILQVAIGSVLTECFKYQVFQERLNILWSFLFGEIA